VGPKAGLNYMHKLKLLILPGLEHPTLLPSSPQPVAVTTDLPRLTTRVATPLITMSCHVRVAASLHITPLSIRPTRSSLAASIRTRS
jgi:hypothetical protein